MSINFSSLAFISVANLVLIGILLAIFGTVALAATRSTDFRRALAGAFRQKAFISVVVILGLSAAGLNAATQFMSLYFKKQAVPLQNPEGLTALPVDMGPWVQLTMDDKLNHEMEEVLQTKEYVFRVYVDSSKLDPSRVARFKDLTWAERQQEAGRIRLERPDAIINAAVTYYTGGADTVAHIPERCYVADGFQPVNPASPTWHLPATDVSPARDLTVRFIAFEDQGQNSRSRVVRSVAYFFQCNGSYFDDPLAVRAQLQTLTEKFGYYAKVELMTELKSQSDSAAVMQDFLSHALPDVEKILPDWQKIKSGAK